MDIPDQNSPCQQIEENLDAFHDGELAAEEKTQVETHLKNCQTCVGKLAEIDRVVHALKSMPRARLDDAASAKLDRLVDQQGKTVRLKPRVWAPMAVAAAVAAIVVGVKFMTPDANVPVTAVNPDPAVKTVPVQQAPPAVATAKPDSSQPAVQPESTVASATPPQAAVKREAPATSKIAKAQQTTAPTTTPIHSEASPLVAEQPARAAAPYVSLLGHDNNDDSIATDLPLAGPRLNDAIGLATDEDGLYDIKM